MTETAPRRKKILQLSIGAILLLVLLLAGAVGLRLPLINLGLSTFLAHQGIEGSLRVTSLTLTGGEVTDISLPGLKTEKLGAQWQVTSWPLSFQLLEVTVLAPEVVLQLDKPPLSPLLAHLPQNAQTTEPSSAPWDYLPLVPFATVTDGKIRLLSGPDQAVISLDTAISSPASAPRTVTASARVTGFDLSGQGQASLILENNRPAEGHFQIALEHKPQTPADASSLTLKSQLAVSGDTLSIKAQGNSRVSKAGLTRLGQQIPQLLQVLETALPPASHGTLSLGLNGQGSWALDKTATAPLQPEDLDLQLDVTANQLTWPDFLSGATFAWAGQLRKETDSRAYLWHPASPLTFQAEQTEGRLLPEEIRSRLPAGFFTQQHVTLELDRLLLDKDGKLAQLDGLDLNASDGAGDRLKARGSAKLDLTQDLWAEADLEAQLTSPTPWPGFSNLDLRLDGHFQHDQAGSLLKLRKLDSLRVESDPALWPEQMAALQGYLSQLSLPTEAALPLALTAHPSVSEQALLTVFLEPTRLSFESQGTLEFDSPLWQDLALTLAANGNKTPKGQWLLDLPKLSLHSMRLHSPYGLADLTLAGSASYLDDFFTSDLTLQLSSQNLTLPQGKAQGLEVTLPLSGSGTLQEIFWQTQDGALSIKKLSAANQVTITPLQLRLKEASGRIAGKNLTSNAQISLAPTTVKHPSQTLSLGAGNAALDLASQAEGQARVFFEKLSASPSQVALADPAFVLSRDEEGDLVMNLQQARLEDLSDDARFPDLGLAGQVELRGERLLLSLEGQLPQASHSPLQITGEYRLDEKQGTATFDLLDLVFDGNLQPKDLHPSLAALSEVEGSFALSGSANISPEGVGESQADIALHLAEATTPFGEITDLSLPVTLSSLWPLESAPDQKITLARFGQGLAVEDLFLRYSLVRQPQAQSPLPVVVIDEAVMRLLGGRVSLNPSRFNPLDKDQDLLLTAEALDLVTVLSLISKEGLTGTGQLEGRIPLELRNGDILIDGARLQAESPGRLAFSSPPTDQALSTGGDHVQLLLSALENFHYKELLLELDKEPDGQSRLLLKMEGSNPDLYDGYPFELNLNLETAAAPLLSALATGSSLYDELIKRAVANR